MAQVPAWLREQPGYQELRYLMREGVALSAARKCPALCNSPRVLAGLEDSDDLSPSAKRDRAASHLVDLLRTELKRPGLPGLCELSQEALFVLLPEGSPKELLGARRTQVAEMEVLSASTLTRREFLFLGALLASLGFELDPAAGEQKGPDAQDSRLMALDGDWFALWETTVHGERNFNMELVHLRVEGRRLAMWNEAPSPHNREGYLWRGTLEPVQNKMLVGSYSAVSPDVEWSGALFFQVGGTKGFMEGRWVGANVDEQANTGIAVLARDQDVARRRFAYLVGGSEEIPRLDQDDS